MKGVDFMKHLSSGLDRSIFINTAKRTRKINLMRFIPRGGIRL